MAVQQNQNWYNIPPRRPDKSIKFCPSNDTEVSNRLKYVTINDTCPGYECDEEWSHYDIIDNNFTNPVTPHTLVRQSYLDPRSVAVDRQLVCGKVNELNSTLERRSSSPRFPYYREQPAPMNDDDISSPQDEFEEFRQRALSLPHRQLLDSKSPNLRRQKVKRNVSPRLDEVYVREATNSVGLPLQVSPRLDILKRVRGPHDEYKNDGSRRSSLSWNLKCDLAKLVRRPEGSFKSHKVDPFRGRSATNPGDIHHWREVPDPDYVDWTPSKSPSQVEQRFLQLPESAEYDKVRAFDVNEAGDIVNTSKGYVYRLRSEASPTPPNVDSSVPPSPLSITADDNLLETANKRYTVLVIGDEEVGKSSLIVHLKSCDLADGCRSGASKRKVLFYCMNNFYMVDE